MSFVWLIYGVISMPLIAILAVIGIEVSGELRRRRRWRKFKREWNARHRGPRDCEHTVYHEEGGE